MTADQIGNIREDLGNLKASISMLTQSVTMQNERSAAERSEMREMLYGMDKKLDKQGAEFTDLSKRVEEMEPSVSDYKLRMEQVKTAGLLGSTLWSFGGIILSAAASVAATYYALMGRTPP